MPPRYAYWTILVDGQPTAFRAAAQEELLPTLKRLKEKHPSAEMKWFQNGKLWNSRVDAQEFMRERGDRGRMGDRRQEGFRDRKPRFERDPRTHDSRPRTQHSRPKTQDSRPTTQDSRPRTEKLEWKPKGEFTPAPKRVDRPDWQPKDRPAARPERRDWKPKESFDRDRKPDWKPKGAFNRDRKPDWKPKGAFDRDRKPDWKPKGAFDRDRKPDWKSRTSKPQDRGDARPARDRERPEWKPKGDAPGSRFPTPDSRRGAPDSRPLAPDSRERRKWVPKEEYKKAKGIERPRDSKWRPGGEHRDPKQKYKDAKKAKWTKFKKNIRQRWESKDKKKS